MPQRHNSMSKRTPYRMSEFRRAQSPDSRLRSASSEPEPHTYGVDTESNLVRLHSAENFPSVQEEEPQEKARCSSGKAWLYPELPWGAPPEWDNNLMRGALFLQVWDVLSFLCCLYVACSVPYLVSFYSAHHDDGCLFHESMTGIAAGAALLNLAVDTIFTMDIILNFHTARWVLSTVGTPHWVLVEDLSRIRRLYLFSTFPSDAIGQIPWQYMDCMFPNMNETLKMLRLLRLLKLFRLYRVRRMIEVLYRKFPKSELLITGFELILTLCLFAHWMSCLWYSVGFPDGWVYAAGLVDEQGNRTESAYHDWVTSFYWAITTMSTIGYGDISAGTTTERTVASVVMVLGCGYFAWATGRLTQILTKTSKCKADFNYKIEELNEYLEARNISTELKEKTMNFYMLKYPTLRIFNEDTILADLPCELKKGVQLELYQDIIKSAPIFELCSPRIQKELCYHLHSKYFEAGAQIMEEGSVPDALYVVRFGFVDVTSGGVDVKVAKKGDVFGENALCGMSEIRRRQRSARAKTECEICVLTKEALEELVVEFPELPSMFTKIARMKIRDLETAPQRGKGMSVADFTCVDWHKYAEIIREDLKFVKLDMDKASVHEYVRHGKKLLRTKFTLKLRSLRNLLGSDMSGGMVFVVVTARDEHGKHNDEAKAESQVMELPAGEGSIEFEDSSLTVELWHKSNHWDRMPNMHFQIYQLPTWVKQIGVGASFRTEVFATAKLEGKGQRNSLADSSGPYEGCTKLWNAYLPMKMVVDARDRGEGCERRLLIADLSPCVGRNGPAQLNIEVTCERLLAPNSPWFRVLPTLTEHGKRFVGGYFSKKQDQMIASMRRAVDSYGRTVRTMRVRKSQQDLLEYVPSRACEQPTAKTKTEPACDNSAATTTDVQPICVQDTSALVKSLGQMNGGSFASSRSRLVRSISNKSRLSLDDVGMIVTLKGMGSPVSQSSLEPQPEPPLPEQRTANSSHEVQDVVHGQQEWERPAEQHGDSPRTASLSRTNADDLAEVVQGQQRLERQMEALRREQSETRTILLQMLSALHGPQAARPPDRQDSQTLPVPREAEAKLNGWTSEDSSCAITPRDLIDQGESGR